MLPDKYLTDDELNEFREEYCNKLCKFGQVRHEMIRQWYEPYSFVYPSGSNNNFRDSWFHYRKIYKERSLLEMIRQTANFEEHLQRAEKDAVVYFLQESVTRTEYWYKQSAKEFISLLSEEEKQQCIRIYEEDESSEEDCWVLTLGEFFLNSTAEDAIPEANRKYAAGCMFCIEQKAQGKLFFQDAQRMIHEMKEVILRIRLNGPEIIRETEPGGYQEQGQMCYEKFMQFCLKYRIVKLIAMTETIRHAA